jgi:hypothetical protein
VLLHKQIKGGKVEVASSGQLRVATGSATSFVSSIILGVT